MNKLQLQDLDLKGKRVVMRADFNVPQNKDGSISDDTRIRATLPTMQYILKQGASLVVLGHIDRPKGKRDPKLSLKPCAQRLSELLGQEVLMADDCIGETVHGMAVKLKPGQVLMLENTRFHAAEEKPSSNPSFVKQLADLGDVYVNDAFGAAHRNHASTAAIATYFPGKAAAGLLMQKEIEAFDALICNPKRPFYAISGGSKISGKMGVIKALVSKVDALFICGGMAFTFYKAQGIPIGNSIHEDDYLDTAKQLMQECAQKNIPLYLPKDLVIADSFNENSKIKNCLASDGIPAGWQGVDIGPHTLAEWGNALKGAQTIFWNGPPGVFEMPPFAKGTRGLAQLLSQLPATVVVGGGDSVSAINQLGLAEKFAHVSTGGGAALEYIELGHLPGIEALSNAPQ